MSSTTLNAEKIIIQPEIIKTEILLSSSELNQEKEKQLKQIQKHIQLPGFRPGKAPMSIVKKKYEGMAFYDAFEELLKDKTKEVLEAQVDMPLYFVYDFDSKDEIKDENKDIKVGLEILIEPKANVDVHSKELELVKYTFTENQRKIFSDLIILYNFVSEGTSESLDNFNTHFILNLEVESPLLTHSEDTSKKEKAKFPLFIHRFEFELYGLNSLLPSAIEKDKSYSIELQKWIEILESHSQSSKSTVLNLLKQFTTEGETIVNLKVNDIIKCDNFAEKLDKNAVKSVFKLNEDTEVNIDVIYTKLNETIDTVSDYFSGVENIKRINQFIENLVEVQLPDDFIEKMYKSYVKNEDKDKITIDVFKLEVKEEIENKILRNLLPNTYSNDVNYEFFVKNVAKYYIVESLLSRMHLMNLETSESFISHLLKQTSDSKYSDQLWQNYFNKEAIFTLSKRIEQDVTTHYKLENINKVHIAEYLGIKEETFA